MDSHFELDCGLPDLYRTIRLESPVGEIVLLTEFINASISYGYAITADEQIIEYACCPSPYYLFVEENDLSDNIYNSAYYDYANYGISNHKIDSEGMICEIKNNGFDNGISVCNITIPGVTPKLQNSSNCIVTALANLMWYWGGNNFSKLRPDSFKNLKSTLQELFLGYQGYTNNSVPYIAQQYVQSRSSSYRCNSSVYWKVKNDVLAKLRTEINAGYPCLLGYMAHANSPYSATSGHMTMCYGYYISDSITYVRLADGHSSSMVVRVWNATYNDCVIKVRPYYETNGGTTQSITSEGMIL